MIPGIVAQVLGTSGGGGGGGAGAPWGSETPTEAVFSDFKTAGGVYRISGTTVTLGDVWEQNTDWGSFDAANVVSGTGLQASSGTTSNPTLKAAAYSAVAPGTTGYVIGAVLKAGASGSVGSEWWEPTYAGDGGFLSALNRFDLFSANLAGDDNQFYTASLSAGDTIKVVALMTLTDAAAKIDHESRSFTTTGSAPSTDPTAISLKMSAGATGWVIEKAAFFQRNADPAAVLALL